MAQGPMTRDEQEALSRRYGSGVLIVLPLSSGSLAIFGPDRQLLSIQEEFPDGEALRLMSAASEERVKALRQIIQVQPRQSRAEAKEIQTDEDLGL